MSVQGEVEYCKSRSRDMWREMVEVELLSDEHDEDSTEILGRVARQAEALCCTCQQGPPGKWFFLLNN